MMIRTSIDEWKTTPWVEIDVENMDMECKKFAKVRKPIILEISKTRSLGSLWAPDF